MRNLTSGNLIKGMVFFTIPILAGNILQQFYNVVDSIIIGKYLGKESLAAVGIAGPIHGTLVSFLIGLTIVAEILISRSIGAKNEIGIKKIANSLFVLIMTGSVLIGIVGWFAAVPLLELINVPSELMPESSRYLKIIFAGLPGVAGYNTLKSFIRSTGNSRVPLIFLGVATISNVLLDLVFIIWFNMGVTGAALATIIAQSIAFLLCFAWLSKINPNLRITLKRKHIDFAVMKKGITLGVPSGLQVAATGLAMVVIQVFVNGFGSTDAITGYTIGIKIDMFIALPAMSIGMAMVAVISQNIGAAKPQRVKQASQNSRIFALGLGVVFGIILYIFSPQIITLFISPQETEVIRYGTMYIRSLSLVYPLATFFSISHGIIKGKGNTLVPMLIMVIGVWLVRIPSVILFSDRLGFASIGMSVQISWIFIFVVTAIYELIVWSKRKNNPNDLQDELII